jgi:plasmid stability protein
MSAITIRNLPEDVHAGLRRLAAARGQSVEAFVRNILAEAVQSAAQPDSTPAKATGMSEATFPWNGPPAGPPRPLPELWGALKGSVHIPPGTDLTAPLDEVWEAAT